MTCGDRNGPSHGKADGSNIVRSHQVKICLLRCLLLALRVIGVQYEVCAGSKSDIRACDGTVKTRERWSLVVCDLLPAIWSNVDHGGAVMRRERGEDKKYMAWQPREPGDSPSYYWEPTDLDPRYGGVRHMSWHAKSRPHRPAGVALEVPGAL